MKDYLRQQIQEAFNTAWAVAPPCTMIWDNQKRPTDTKVAFACVSIEYGTWQPMALGTIFSRLGITLRISLYLPENTGTAIAAKAADVSDAAFQYQERRYTPPQGTVTINGDQGSTGPIPNGTDGGYRVYRLTHILRADVGKPD